MTLKNMFGSPGILVPKPTHGSLKPASSVRGLNTSPDMDETPETGPMDETPKTLHLAFIQHLWPWQVLQVLPYCSLMAPGAKLEQEVSL